MEIKCKVSFTLPEDLIEALGIDEDTPIIASVSYLRSKKTFRISSLR